MIKLVNLYPKDVTGLFEISVSHLKRLTWAMEKCVNLLKYQNATEEERKSVEVFMQTMETFKNVVEQAEYVESN